MAAERDLFLAAEKDCGIQNCLPTKPITTKHQYVFRLVKQSRRMSAIFVGTCRWISLVAASADHVVYQQQFAKADSVYSFKHKLKTHLFTYGFTTNCPF